MSVRAAIPTWQMNIRCDIELDLVSGTGYLTAAAAADSTGMDTIGEMALNPCHIPAPASQSVNSRPKRKVLARKTINSSLY
jgi:hypothetical protein